MIAAAYSVGLFVRVCVSDMAAVNQDMWKAVGVCSTRNTLQHFIQHPCNPQQRLYFMADPPHLLKNVRNCLLAQSIILPSSAVSAAELLTDTVTLDQVQNLVVLQRERELNLAPKLTKAHIAPGRYQKMRVDMAAQLMSHTTASALRFCESLKMLQPEALTTAWFFDVVNRWFDIMNARTSKAALCKSSTDKLAALKQAVDVVVNLKFSGRNAWKPIQAGIQLSTASVIDLHHELVLSGAYSFLLTGRLTQDCVENLFSCIRGRGDMHPSPVHFRHNLRTISLSQYMDTAANTCYTQDDSTYILDFLKTKPVQTVPLSDDEFQFLDSSFVLDDSEEMLDANVCYMLAGWAVHKEMATVGACEDCLAAMCGHETDTPADCSATQLMVLKSHGGLSEPSPLIHSAVQVAEAVFKSCQPHLTSWTDVESKLNDEFRRRFETSVLPSCHNILSDIISRYFRLRLHVYGKWLTQQHKMGSVVQHGSRSAFCRTKIT